jgi:hypothetical protein
MYHKCLCVNPKSELNDIKIRFDFVIKPRQMWFFQFGYFL